MRKHQVGRRDFIAGLAGAAAGNGYPRRRAAPRIKFGVIGMNHSHINGQTEAVLRGGGELVSAYAKEPDLAAAFQKRFPQARQAEAEQEVLDDPASSSC